MSSSNHGFLRKLWSEYCQGSTIYATRHLSSQLRIGERLWWFSWIGLALVACFVAIVDVYDKWNLSPVFISYDNRMHPVWAIPFPAITICPMARAQVELFNSTDVYFRIDQPAGISNLEWVFSSGVHSTVSLLNRTLSIADITDFAQCCMFVLTCRTFTNITIH